MAENEKSDLDGKLVFLLIALAVLFGLLILRIVFTLFFLDVPKKNISGIISGTHQQKPAPNQAPGSPPSLSASPTPSPISSLNSGPTSQSPPFSSSTPVSPKTAGSQTSQTSPTSTLPITYSFENGLAGWTAIGDVLLINQLKNSDGFTKPFAGDFMVRIGRAGNQGYPLSQNQLSLQLPTSAHTLSFSYNFFSYDYQGFDDPGFAVFLNNKIIFQKSASEIDSDNSQATTEKLDSSHWQTIQLPLANLSQSSPEILSFKAGNDEQNLVTEQPHQSWVYVDSIQIE